MPQSAPDSSDPFVLLQTHFSFAPARVLAAVPPDRLLVFRVTDGWGPLCRFLGVPEPQEPFPNLNDREHIKQTIRELIRGCYVTLATYVAGGALVLGGLWWALR